MATHRSLNKLEFKAHMSIHNLKDVEEAETHELNATRDRFGKRHPLTEPTGESRIVRRKRPIRALVLAVLCSGLLNGWAAAGERPAGWEAKPPARPNTDIRVETDGLDANSWLNQKINEPEDKFGFAVDENTAVGINEDGDPNVAMTF